MPEPTKKPTSSSSGDTDAMGILLVVFILFSFVGVTYERVRNYADSQGIEMTFETFVDYAYEITNPLRFFSIILSALFFIGIIILSIKIGKISKEGSGSDSSLHQKTDTELVNKKWQRIISHLESNNQSDWKLAIMEADIILGEMLDKMGYPGENIGEKLKNVEKSDFENLEIAWQAHKIRNEIAHQGYDYVISKKEALNTIELYEKVFKEFHFI